MKVLLIDNHSKHINELLKKFNDIEVVDFENIKLNSLNSFDLIILSGGSSFSVKNHSKKYSKELKLIKNTKKPVLGICLGFELICFVFGEELVKMKSKERGIISIRKYIQDPILNLIPNKFKVFESHRWVVKETKYLDKIAFSNDGVEIVKHHKKKIYGLQFHPEVFVKNGYGDKILKNFIFSCL